MPRTFPTTSSAIEPEWLTESLRSTGTITSSRVTRTELASIGEGVGMLAVLTRIGLTYDQPEAGAPASVVAKFASTNEANRAVATAFGVYEREALFLRDVAGLTTVPVPIIHAVDFDATSGDFVILMEDLDGYRTGDQVLGCGPDEAAVILDAAAPLHARFWGAVDQDVLSFVPRVNGEMQRSTMSGACAVGWDPCLERFGAAIPEPVRAVRDRFLAAVPALHDRMGALTQTVVHGDLRLDNIMFGQSPMHRPLVLLDWQGVLISAAAQDVAYLLTQNLTTDERRTHERALLARYHGRLVEHGVVGYDVDTLWDDYRLAALYLFIYAVVIGGTLDPGNERGMAFMSKLIERSTATILDHDLLSLL